MILITSYFNGKCPIHQKEIDYCIESNLNNELIENVVLFLDPQVEISQEWANNKKVIVVKNDDRFKFSHAFNYANNFKGKIILVANSVIFFDATLQVLNNCDLSKTVIVITRKDFVDGKVVDSRDCTLINPEDSHLTGSVTFGVSPHWSFDAVAFRSPLPEFEAGFYLGYLHTECKLREAIRHTEFNLVNAYKYINAIHYHSSTDRHYTNFYDIDLCRSLGPMTNFDLTLKE